MTIERSNPPGLHIPDTYHHVTVTDARTTIYLAGQCPQLEDGSTITGGLKPQVDQVIANTAAALEAAGATPEDVVRTVVYVATTDATELSDVWDQFVGSEIGAAFSTASTLTGVTVLGYPGQLVELDVTAVRH